MTSTPEWVRVYRLAGRYDAEIVHAHYVGHRFSRHAHEHLVIGLVEEGVQRYTYGGTKHTTPPGHIFFVNGGEPHTGEPASTDGYTYRTLCLSPGALRHLAADITDKDEQHWLDGATVADRDLFSRLQRLHSAVADHAPTLHCESLLLAAVGHLLATHVETHREPPAPGNDNGVAAQVRQFLEAHYAEDVSLAQLAILTSRSPFHVARTFARNMGLPPHAFMESLRIARARELLRSGMTVVETALSVGYADQSHFTHRFRRHTGFTPGQYRTATRGHLSATP